MFSILITGYAGCWAVATVASFLFGKGLAEDGTPPIGLIGMSVLAGIVWPLLLAAVVEMTSFAVYSHAAASRATPIPDWW